MARTLSPEEYEEIGKSYYRLKQFEKAVEAFTNGIDASAIPSATLYDYRAAAHEKLGDMNAAVKDGRLAIRTHKQDVKGYLRTASALQKMEKLDTALNIYKYGMKNVPVNNKDFPLLLQLHDKLTRTLSPPKAIDPFTILPVELVEMVIGYLSFKNMINCLRVSRGWKEYLTNRPKLWANIDLSSATKSVSRSFLANAVRYSRGTLHTLTVHRVQHTDMLRNIATACENLHALTILSFPYKISETFIGMAQSAQNLKRISIYTEVSVDTMIQILRKRPALELVDLKDLCAAFGSAPMVWKGGPYNGLQTLALQCNASPVTLSDNFVSTFIQKAFDLRSLTCVNIKVQRDGIFGTFKLHATRLTSLTLKKFHGHVTIPSTLERLVYDPSYPAFIAEPSCSRSLTHLTLGDDVNLRRLSDFLDYSGNPGDETRLPIENAKPLQHLSLAGTIERDSVDNSTPSSTIVSTFLSTSPRILTRALTSLELPGQPLTDDDIDPIIESTSLTTINISNTNVSGYGIKKLVDGVPTLRHINADHCRNLSSRDVIEYAKKRGVHVSYTMAEPSNGAKGRKVRYG
ncbi:hypothetical protein DPSP01_011613 [Paraphaeosphaeria sporulosa]|uniref:F-box domain-containing protein n=1 Tax=Paraphaeosphaeria sporulosa TaxID=1460663 RepID=A0A177CDV6_9PLEO|nr:uncharacterized protein CC84DRAFT_1164259 [Paraphaeosphaeria sporulosa]OAG05813.1 hypothetical protein CC84DRAFT_1164259 [Paraphaeosphaeria sporulosa]